MPTQTAARPTPRQIRKAFGPQAIGAIDSHADAIEALNHQVSKLSIDNQKLQDQMDALLDGVSQVQSQHDALVEGQLVTATRLIRLERPWWKRILA